MLVTVIKRDGSEEEFQPSKLNKWLKWATKEFGKRVDWGMIARKAIRNLGEKVSSQVLQRALIDTAVEQKNWAYSKVAGMLYGPMYQKEIFPKGIPTIKEQQAKLLFTGYMKGLDYEDSDYQYLESIIDHTRDFKYAYFQLEQFRNKYAIRNRITNEVYETPQFIFMRMAMALAEDEKENRLEHVVKWYNYFSWNMINAPTPNYTNLGTLNRGLLSCCLYLAGDSIGSLAAADHISYIMTAMSAGIGGALLTRSINDPVRNGVIRHQGKMPYYDLLGKSVHANRQGGRGGAATTYISCFDPEVIKVINAQNPRTPVDAQNRDIHFGIKINKLLARKALKNEKVFTFNIYTAPDLTEAFYSSDESEFETLYAKYEADPNFIKNYVSARDIWVASRRERNGVATLYTLNIAEANRHTPFKEPIYSSNLCVAPETLLLTDKGEFPISTLAGQWVNVWNGKQWSNVQVVKTGENQRLIKVHIQSQEDRKIIECTPYHKFYRLDITKKSEESIFEVTADKLVAGDRLTTFMLPVIDKDTGNVEMVPKFSNHVISVEFTERYDDTYCVSEPLEHKAVFNGILTGNCNEVLQPTKAYNSVADLYRVDHHDGEVSMCGLGGIVECNIPNDEIYADVAYYTLKMIDKCIHMSDYPLPHIRYTATRRLNAGVGLVGVATTMARRNVRYDTKEGRKELHRIAERHAYFVIEASLRLGKELGNAEWIDKTKWPDGWLPIDTYAKAVDELVEPNYEYDWEDLRSRIIANRGMRNSTVINHPPTESSSKAAGVPNSYLPIRDLYLNKTDQENKLEWVAMDGDILGDQYHRAFDMSIVDSLKSYAVIQKFTDQGMSNDTYKDRIKEPELNTEDFMEELRVIVKYGVKGEYYMNSLTPKPKKVDTMESAMSKSDNSILEELVISNDRSDCAGCSL